MLNTGIATGIQGSYPTLFIICVVFFIAMLLWCKKLRMFFAYFKIARVGIFMSLIGGVGNLFESIIVGGVNDFIELENIAFNYNDILIITGVFLMIIAFIRLIYLNLKQL